MKKLMLAALAAMAFVAAPAAANAQQNQGPLQPLNGLLTAINCLLTCHPHHHVWFTGTAGKTKPNMHPKPSYGFKPKYTGYSKGPQFKFSGFNKGPQFFGKGPQFGKFSGFSKGPQFGKFSGFSKGPQFKGSKFGGKKYSFHKPHKPAKAGGLTRHHSHGGMPFYVGAVICAAAGPIINAALGGPEPTPEQVLLSTAGCFIPPLGIALMLQNLGAF